MGFIRGMSVHMLVPLTLLPKPPSSNYVTHCVGLLTRVSYIKFVFLFARTRISSEIFDILGCYATKICIQSLRPIFEGQAVQKEYILLGL